MGPALSSEAWGAAESLVWSVCISDETWVVEGCCMPAIAEWSGGWGGGQEWMLQYHAPQWKLTPHKSCRPSARVVHFRGSLTLSRPHKSWEMMKNMTNCLPKPFHQKGTHVSTSSWDNPVHAENPETAQAKGRGVPLGKTDISLPLGHRASSHQPSFLSSSLSSQRLSQRMSSSSS